MYIYIYIYIYIYNNNNNNIYLLLLLLLVYTIYIIIIIIISWQRTSTQALQRFWTFLFFFSMQVEMSCFARAGPASLCIKLSSVLTQPTQCWFMTMAGLIWIKISSFALTGFANLLENIVFSQ